MLPSLLLLLLHLSDLDLRVRTKRCHQPRSSTDMNALLMGVLIGQFKEECAGGMEQRTTRKNAVVKGVQIMLLTEECAGGMGQRSHANYAAKKDARVKLRKEDYALGMVKGGNYAAGKDARMVLSKEECVRGMEQRLLANDMNALLKGVLIKSKKEVCAGSTGRRI